MIYHYAMQILYDIYLLNSHRDRQSFSVIDERESIKIGRSVKFQNYLRSLTPSPQNFPQRLEDYPSYLGFGAFSKHGQREMLC